MASIRLRYQQPKGASDNQAEGRISIQITHKSRTRTINTGYGLLPDEWDRRRERPVIPDDPSRFATVAACRETIMLDLSRLKRIITVLEASSPDYTVDEIFDAYRIFMLDYSLFSFMSSQISLLRHRRRMRTAETYVAALRSFSRFRGGHDIMLDALTQEVVMGYEDYLRDRGLTPNTTSFYMRILRAVYNRAVERGGIEQKSPFRKVYTGVDHTRKRALPLVDIRRISRLSLASTPHLEYARDIFMLSFYMRGMSLIDMAYLRKSDLRDGYVAYRRRKTGQKLCVAWTHEMQSIVDKYPSATSPYLLPVFRSGGSDSYAAYRNVSYRINRSLKQISVMIGSRSAITLYCARHSWASIAQTKNIPISVISAGMGHASESTTRIYLASLDTSVVDRANSVIIKSVF